MVRRFKDDFGDKKRRRAKIKALLILFTLLAAIGGVFYFLFLSGRFEVKNVKVSAPEPLKEDVIKNEIINWLEETKLGIKRKNNLFFLSSQKLTSLLADSFPEVKDIEINKNRDYILEINLSKREPKGIWCSVSGCFYFDDKLIAYAQTSNSSGFVLLNVQDKREGEIRLGDYLEGLWVDNIFNSKSELEKTGIAVREVIIPHDSKDEFHLITSVNFLIYMSLFTDISKQIKAFTIAWEDKITEEEKAELEYVDLRVPDRIYYK